MIYNGCTWNAQGSGTKERSMKMYFHLKKEAQQSWVAFFIESNPQISPIRNKSARKFMKTEHNVVLSFYFLLYMLLQCYYGWKWKWDRAVAPSKGDLLCKILERNTLRNKIHEDWTTCFTFIAPPAQSVVRMFWWQEQEMRLQPVS